MKRTPPGESAPPRRIVVPASAAGRRLDVVLAAALPDLSRSQLQGLIRAGHVTVEGTRTLPKPGALVEAGDTITLTAPPPRPAGITAEPVPIAILYEDDDLLVIDKAAGMVVHPGAGHQRGTLVNALLHHVKGLSVIGGQERPGIVHRLDRGTSGVMVVAKSDRAHRSLADQFRERRVDKEYLALVWGTPQATRIERPIGRDPRQRLKMSSRARSGRPAVTTILEVKPYGGVSLVRIALGTGRTHQIRVHLSEAGHPVVGDGLYGGVRRRVPAAVAAVRRLDRPFLHASRLAFTHPVSGRRLSVSAPLPPDLTAVLDGLGAR